MLNRYFDPVEIQTHWNISYEREADGMLARWSFDLVEGKCRYALPRKDNIADIRINPCMVTEIRPVWSKGCQETQLDCGHI